MRNRFDPALETLGYFSHRPSGTNEWIAAVERLDNEPEGFFGAAGGARETS
jgi:hypothetical protein